ncbi:MAG TPA: hypothetical protein DCL61_02295 [Cyanobacteria bacterium UBA12227]|nr:hypothetical protein [Cyanobacteria bacterium UBA12227]
MSLQFALLGWSASGLRCPDHEVHLSPPNSIQPYPVTLVQMPNGTGKTTTLNMLRATLSGAARQWSSEKIREFRRSSNSSQIGKFIIKLAVNGNRLTFELELDFKKGRSMYRTSYGTGIQDGFCPPAQLRKFLNLDFVNLFVFDGELASNLLDPKQTRARNAIDSLFQLSLLEEVANKLQENWERHAESASSKSSKGLNRRKNRLNELKRKRDKINKEQERLHKDKSQLELDIQEADQDYEIALSKDQNIGSQLTLLKGQLDTAEKGVTWKVTEEIANMRNPQTLLPEFGTALQNLKANLDRLKLPTSTSRQFFEELAEERECVCGRTIDCGIRQKIRDRAKNYLGEDEVGVLNNIKADIATYCAENPATYHQELQEQLKDLGTFIRKRDELKTELDSLEADRLAQGDSDLEEKKKCLEELRKKFNVCTERLKEIERSPHSKPSDDTDCIKELDKLIEKAEYDVAEATETLTLKRKTEIARSILLEAHQQAREELRKYILEQTNNRITQLLSRDPVLLEDIQNSLRLRGQGGASVGQTLSVSYAFLATLFNRSDHQLPFIVDSPAGALDLNVRPEVARLIPSLCDQFVAFTISSERQSFVDILHQAAKEKVEYLTLFRKTSRMNELWRNVPPEQLKETVDGVIIKGKDFFDRFDLDKEI